MLRGPYTYDEAKKYASVLRAAIQVIRQECPQAKIMPASSGWQVADGFQWFKALSDEGLLSQVDVIGFHPLYNASPDDPDVTSFPEAFPRFTEMMRRYGFTRRNGE